MVTTWLSLTPDKLSLIRELIKSEKVEINGEKVSLLLPGYDFCMSTKEEIDFVEKAYRLQLEKKLKKIEEQN